MFKKKANTGSSRKHGAYVKLGN